MKWKERALVALLGVVTTLVTLELLLRVVGWGAQRLAPSGQREAGSKYTVLCVGDSFTAGYWSLPPSDAYPAQLETIFAERLGAGRVQVVNRGRSGQNTFQVLHRLDDDLGATRPDAVVVLAGGNNEWDLFSYYRYCEGDSWSASLKDQVYRLRVFKLVKLLSRDVANRLTSASRSPEMLFNLPAYSLRELRRRRQTTVEGQIAYDRGMAFWTAQGTIRAGDSATAESCFREALKHDADSVGAWLNIAWLRAVRGDAEGMVSSFLYG